MVFHQCEAFHALSGRPSGWISCHSGSNWMAVLKCALRLSFRTNSLSQWWQLKGFSLVWSLSCTLRLSFWMNFLSQLNGVKQDFHQMTELNDFTSDLNGNKCMHASEQQIVIKMRTTKSHRNPRFFVHYWELSTTGRTTGYFLES